MDSNLPDRGNPSIQIMRPDRRSVQLPGGKGVLALQLKDLRQKVGHRQTVKVVTRTKSGTDRGGGLLVRIIPGGFMPIALLF